LRPSSLPGVETTQITVAQTWVTVFTMTPDAERTGASATPGHGRLLTVANGLTLLRLVLAPACALAVVGDQRALAFVFFWLAVATDLADGPIARRRGETSVFGAFFDHGTDALFVTSGLAALAQRGDVPVLLPILVVLAFTQYTLDSRVLSGQALRTSRLGRWNGIAYYVVLGIPVCRDAISLSWPRPNLVEAFAWALIATTLLSMTDRAIAYTQTRIKNREA
jgi:CDP-diacylglycerol--glycerol-3-phosphate 3-phosphatidyltransferase